MKSLDSLIFSIKSSKKSDFLSLKLSDSKPNYKFKFSFEDSKKTFASESQSKQMSINLVGTQYFLSLTDKKVEKLEVKRKIVLRQR